MAAMAMFVDSDKVVSNPVQFVVYQTTFDTENLYIVLYNFFNKKALII